LSLFDVTLAVFLTYICFDFAFSLSESESDEDESDEEVHDLIVILIHGDNIKFDFILYLQSYVILLKTKLYFT